MGHDASSLARTGTLRKFCMAAVLRMRWSFMRCWILEIDLALIAPVPMTSVVAPTALITPLLSRGAAAANKLLELALMLEPTVAKVSKATPTPASVPKLGHVDHKPGSTLISAKLMLPLVGSSDASPRSSRVAWLEPRLLLPLQVRTDSSSYM